MLYASRVSGVIDLAGRPAMATLYVIHIHTYTLHVMSPTHTRLRGFDRVYIYLKKKQPRVRVYVIWVRSERLEIH